MASPLLIPSAQCMSHVKEVRAAECVAQSRREGWFNFGGHGYEADVHDDGCLDGDVGPGNSDLRSNGPSGSVRRRQWIAGSCWGDGTVSEGSFWRKSVCPG